MSDDDKLDREAIQKRRALLIASAVLGLSACGAPNDPPPEPCLSPPYDPPTDQPPTDQPPTDQPPTDQPPTEPGAGGGAATTAPPAASGPPPLVCLSVDEPTAPKKP